MRKRAKRPYKKPEVFKVKLTPEEAVLSGCKQDTGAGGGPLKPQKCTGATCASDPGS